MNRSQSRDSLAHVGSAFARHLREQTARACLDLAVRLVDLGDRQRAELLCAFVRDGDHVTDAAWWAPEARCFVSLDLPTEPRPGDLWFDPLELSYALIQPWLPSPEDVIGDAGDSPEFFAWTSLEPVASWQLLGAHEISSDIPQDPTGLTGEQATRYCTLFGKTLTGSSDWLYLKGTYGMAVVRRMWQNDSDQLGSYGAISGVVEIISLDEIAAAPVHGDWEARETSELIPVGLPFRTSATVDTGLWSGPRTIDRNSRSLRA